MTKTQKLLLISVPFILGAYLIYRQFRKPKPLTAENLNQKEKEIKEVKETPKKIENPTNNCSYPLKKGLYNCSVVGTLQKALNTYPFKLGNVVNIGIPSNLLTTDNDFGPKTEKFLNAVTSDLSINRSSKLVTYTWFTVPTENDFNNLVTEIQKAITEESFHLGVSPLPNNQGDPNSWENNPLNPNYQITHPNG